MHAVNCTLQQSGIIYCAHSTDPTFLLVCTNRSSRSGEFGLARRALFSNPCEVRFAGGKGSGQACLLQRRSIHAPTLSSLAATCSPPIPHCSESIASPESIANVDRYAALSYLSLFHFISPGFGLRRVSILFGSNHGQLSTHWRHFADHASPNRRLSLHAVLTATAAPPPPWVRNAPSLASRDKDNCSSCKLPTASDIHSAAEGSVQQTQCSSDTG